jgi:hypothetical protein
VVINCSSGGTPIVAAPGAPVQRAVVVSGSLIVDGALTLEGNTTFETLNATVHVQGALTLRAPVILVVDTPPPPDEPLVVVLFNATGTLSVDPLASVDAYQAFEYERACEQLVVREQRTDRSLAVVLSTSSDACGGGSGGSFAAWHVWLPITACAAATLLACALVLLGVYGRRRGWLDQCCRSERPEDRAIRKERRQRNHKSSSVSIMPRSLGEQI